MYDCKLVIDARAELGEGPIWDAEQQVLYWVDILGENLHIYDPARKQDQVIPIGQQISTVVPYFMGRVALTTENGFFSLELDNGKLTPIADPERDRPNNRFNDGKCDAAGRFWAGTMSMDGSGRSGSLYCLDLNGNVKTVLGDIACSNGIAWSLDNKKMYYIDSGSKQVVAFDYDIELADISNRSIIVDLSNENVYPDGMTIDAEGMIWVALWDGYRVNRWNPATGELLDTISVPTGKVSACAFGGPNLDELYITTARENMSAEQLENEPIAGGLFCVKTAVKGVPSHALRQKRI
ncbi:sugar lactone lactonase YvrE [Paenibacillus castaneae]|uniref:SMP-30/gluconolactonase/LRE family protein n=1 Tax=Paenibacillus castaneae TaxID=474957 RepID=UPI000C9C05FA|nr:SMP-30/gluconolactonase/LRE family protein [Paenibacillus castaneae]NIK78700.1 sugar lactone lactonase YvrE [Paenibacillus castaneae]